MRNRTITIDLTERERKEAAASRRFPVSVSSETPVPRYDYAMGGQVDEVLRHTPGSIDLSRAPLPVLEGHDRTRVNVGIVRDLRVDGTRLRGVMVLGSSQRAQELAVDIGDGIVTGLSIGYVVQEQERDVKAKRVTATRWAPYEVSITPVPADTTVGIGRSSSMDIDDPTTTTTTTPPATEGATASERAMLLERERVTEIRSLVTRHMPEGEREALTSELIESGAPLARAREVLLERLAARDATLPPFNTHVRVDLGMNGADDFRRAAIDSLLLRAGIPVAKPHAAAGDVSASVYDLARLCLSRADRSGRLPARGPELLKRAATTSDFSAILEGALHASLRNGYENEPASHRAWVRVAPFADFRPASRPILGSAPSLARVLEGAEYTEGYFDDDGTSYSVAKYGKIITLSWEALVNDNLGAFLRVQPALGVAARRLEADLVYALFPLNSGAGPTMNDTKALFHADHANLTSAGAFDATLLGAARTLLRKQTAVGGGYLSLVPRFWIVPAERETAAETILSNASRAMTSERTTPEWISNLELVVEPRLANTAAYLAADASQVDTVELGLLDENVGGPFIETEQGFNTDESRWKIRHTAGVKALDYRGMVKMPISG